MSSATIGIVIGVIALILILAYIVYRIFIKRPSESYSNANQAHVSSSFHYRGDNRTPYEKGQDLVRDWKERKRYNTSSYIVDNSDASYFNYDLD